MSRWVDGSSSSSSSRLLREAGGQQHALPFAAAQRLQQPIAQIPAVRPPHRPLDRRAILVAFEPAIGVRIAAHQHELAGQERQIGPHRLRQMRDDPGARARIPAAERAIVELHVPAGRTSSKPGDDVEQRALPGAVAAHDDGDLPAANVERHARQHRHGRRPATRRPSTRSRTAHRPGSARSSAATHSAASTTRGPGTTSASVVAAWTCRVLTAVSMPYAFQAAR